MFWARDAVAMSTPSCLVCVLYSQDGSSVILCVRVAMAATCAWRPQSLMSRRSACFSLHMLVVAKALCPSPTRGSVATTSPASSPNVEQIASASVMREFGRSCSYRRHARMASSASTRQHRRLQATPYSLIEADQARPDAHAVGNPVGLAAVTPNIDSIALEGVRFARAYSSTPICTPARLAILTGRSPMRHGMRSYFSRVPAPGCYAGTCHYDGVERIYTCVVGKNHYGVDVHGHFESHGYAESHIARVCWTMIAAPMDALSGSMTTARGSTAHALGAIRWQQWPEAAPQPAQLPEASCRCDALQFKRSFTRIEKSCTQHVGQLTWPFGHLNDGLSAGDLTTAVHSFSSFVSSSAFAVGPSGALDALHA